MAVIEHSGHSTMVTAAHHDIWLWELLPRTIEVPTISKFD